jgi:hypothetical protein
VTRQEIRSDLLKRKRDFVDQAIASSFNMIMIAEKIKDPQSRLFIQSIEEFWKRVSNSQ